MDGEIRCQRKKNSPKISGMPTRGVPDEWGRKKRSCCSKELIKKESRHQRMET